MRGFSAGAMLSYNCASGAAEFVPVWPCFASAFSCMSLAREAIVFAVHFAHMSASLLLSCPLHAVPREMAAVPKKTATAICVVPAAEHRRHEESPAAAVIRDVATAILSFRSLRTLSLRHCNLYIIPSELSQLKCLQSLDVSHNALVSWPADVGSKAFPSLRAVHLDHNDFEAFPEEICSIVKLSTITLSHNRIRALPATLRNLSQLTTFDLSYNQVILLYSSRDRTVSWCECCVTCVQIGPELPVLAFSRLKCLVSLRLEHNCIDVIPDTLSAMFARISCAVTIHGNPMNGAGPRGETPSTAEHAPEHELKVDDDDAAASRARRLHAITEPSKASRRQMEKEIRELLKKRAWDAQNKMLEW